jgi:predicted metal-dependent RNase
MIRLEITVGFAALALATAFASAPAFAAQDIPGHSSGGAVIAIHHHRHHSGVRPLYYNYNPGYGGPSNYSGYASGQPGPSSGIESQR